MGVNLQGTDSVLVQSFFSGCSAFRHGNAVFTEQILKQECLTLNNGVEKLKNRGVEEPMRGAFFGW